MDTKRIGNIGEAKVLCKFVEMGVPVYVPFGDNERADLVADFNGKLQKIQVKTSEHSSDGKTVFYVTTNTGHSGQNKHKYNENEVDYFALYSVERDKIFMVKVENERTTYTIRYEKPLNNQTKGIIFEDDVIIDNVIGDLA